MKQSAETASDAEDLLDQARQRIDKLLSNVQQEQSKWQSADSHSLLRKQGGAAMAEISQAIQELAAAIDAGRSTGQGGANQRAKHDYHDG